MKKRGIEKVVQICIALEPSIIADVDRHGERLRNEHGIDLSRSAVIRALVTKALQDAKA